MIVSPTAQQPSSPCPLPPTSNAPPCPPDSLSLYPQINPMSWIFRCITINEFTSPRWNVPALAVDGEPLGHFTLNQWGMWPNYHVSWWEGAAQVL